MTHPGRVLLSFLSLSISASAMAGPRALHASELSTSGWTLLDPGSSSPPPRMGHSTVYDPLGQRFIVFGGNRVGEITNDVLAYNLTEPRGWVTLHPEGEPPPPRMDHTAVLDPVRNRMWVFGGSTNFIRWHSLGDLWALELTDPPRWRRLGTAPPARFGHTAVLDPNRDRMLLFGGENDHQCGETRCSQTLNDVWALSLADPPAWSSVAASGNVPSRREHVAVYRGDADRMVVFGGFGNDPYDRPHYGLLNDVWELTFAGPTATWTRVEPSGTAPSARDGHAAIYDPVSARMVVFGGGDDQPWSLAISPAPTWTQLVLPAPRPSGRDDHSAVYDSANRRMVVYSGVSGICCLDDLWALGLDKTTAVLVSAARVLAEDSRVRIAWTIGGAMGEEFTVERRLGDGGWEPRSRAFVDAHGQIAFDDLDVRPGDRAGYRLTWREQGAMHRSAEEWVTVPRTMPLSLLGARPNPIVGGRLSIALSLPGGAPARLELLDCGGRRVHAQSVELGAGTHVVRLVPSSRLRPGLYQALLTQGSRSARAKVVVLD